MATADQSATPWPRSAGTGSICGRRLGWVIGMRPGLLSLALGGDLKGVEIARRFVQEVCPEMTKLVEFCGCVEKLHQLGDALTDADVLRSCIKVHIVSVHSHPILRGMSVKDLVDALGVGDANLIHVLARMFLQTLTFRHFKLFTSSRNFRRLTTVRNSMKVGMGAAASGEVVLQASAVHAAVTRTRDLIDIVAWGLPSQEALRWYLNPTNTDQERFQTSDELEMDQRLVNMCAAARRVAAARTDVAHNKMLRRVTDRYLLPCREVGDASSCSIKSLLRGRKEELALLHLMRRALCVALERRLGQKFEESGCGHEVCDLAPLKPFLNCVGCMPAQGPLPAGIDQPAGRYLGEGDESLRTVKEELTTELSTPPSPPMRSESSFSIHSSEADSDVLFYSPKKRRAQLSPVLPTAPRLEQVLSLEPGGGGLEGWAVRPPVASLSLLRANSPAPESPKGSEGAEGSEKGKGSQGAEGVEFERSVNLEDLIEMLIQDVPDWGGLNALVALGSNFPSGVPLPLGDAMRQRWRNGEWAPCFFTMCDGYLRWAPEGRGHAPRGGIGLMGAQVEKIGDHMLGIVSRGGMAVLIMVPGDALGAWQDVIGWGIQRAESETGFVLQRSHRLSRGWVERPDARQTKGEEWSWDFWALDGGVLSVGNDIMDVSSSEIVVRKLPPDGRDKPCTLQIMRGKDVCGHYRFDVPWRLDLFRQAIGGRKPSFKAIKLLLPKACEILSASTKANDAVWQSYLLPRLSSDFSNPSSKGSPSLSQKIDEFRGTPPSPSTHPLSPTRAREGFESSHSLSFRGSKQPSSRRLSSPLIQGNQSDASPPKLSSPPILASRRHSKPTLLLALLSEDTQASPQTPSKRVSFSESPILESQPPSTPKSPTRQDSLRPASPRSPSKSPLHSSRGPAPFGDILLPEAVNGESADVKSKESAWPPGLELLHVCALDREGVSYKAKRAGWGGRDGNVRVRCIRVGRIRGSRAQETLAGRVMTAMLTHPFIQTVYQAWCTDNTLYQAISDYEMTLSQRVEKEGGAVTELAARVVAAELVLALEFVHSFDIVHRNVSGENVLVDMDGHVRLAEWGMCCPEISERRRTNDMVGVPDYQAPEVLAGQGWYGKEADWWALGVLTYEMIHGEGPFLAASTQKVYSRIRTETPHWSNELSASGRIVLEGLLRHEATDRLGCEKLGGPATLKAQAWFVQHGIRWDRLLQKKHASSLSVKLLDSSNVRSMLSSMSSLHRVPREDLDDFLPTSASVHAPRSPAAPPSARSPATPQRQGSTPGLFAPLVSHSSPAVSLPHDRRPRKLLNPSDVLELEKSLDKASEKQRFGLEDCPDRTLLLEMWHSLGAWD